VAEDGLGGLNVDWRGGTCYRVWPFAQHLGTSVQVVGIESDHQLVR
jgi:hypothetical protein